MTPATDKSARQLLDEVQRLPQVEAFDPDGFLAQLRAEIAAETVTTVDDLALRDGVLRGVLAAIDGFAGRCMRIRLDHLLIDDRSIGGPFRLWIGNAVATHAGDLAIIHERVAATVARVHPYAARATADAVLAAAEQVVAVRATLRAGLFAFARELAAAFLPTALAAARDVWSPEPVRLRWSAARRVLAQIAAHPALIAEAGFEAHLAAQPKLLDEVDQQPQFTREELIELD